MLISYVYFIHAFVQTFVRAVTAYRQTTPATNPLVSKWPRRVRVRIEVGRPLYPIPNVSNLCTIRALSPSISVKCVTGEIWPHAGNMKNRFVSRHCTKRRSIIRLPYLRDICTHTHTLTHKKHAPAAALRPFNLGLGREREREEQTRTHH